MIRPVRSIAAFILSIALSAGARVTAAADPQVFPIAQSGVAFLTGDTWEQNGQRFRLYGVQSCIRGTVYTNPVGTRQDCGEASIALFAALVRDTHPTCSPIAQVTGSQGQPPTILAICTAHIGDAAPDLGQILISKGYAFAAFTNEVSPVYLPYVVTEAIARKQRQGLWASPDFTHPNLILFRELRAAK